MKKSYFQITPIGALLTLTYSDNHTFCSSYSSKNLQLSEVLLSSRLLQDPQTHHPVWVSIRFMCVIS